MAPYTTVKKVTVTAKNAATHKIWPVLEDFIRVADAANIPVCGGAFGVLTYLIDSFNEVKDNKDAYARLRVALGSSVKDLSDFVSVLPTAYLSCSNERHAIIARDAIKTFDNDLQHIHSLLQEQEKQNKRNRLSQMAYRAKIKGDIESCTARLQQSHQAFRVVTGSVVRTSPGETPYDEWQITGAKPLPSHAVGPMKPAVGILKNWWGNDNEEFVQARVDGEDRVVKLFRGERREKAFLDSLKFLQEHSLLDISDKHTYYAHTIKIWKCAVEMKEAVEFIIAQNRNVLANAPYDWASDYVQEIFKGAMVDGSGSITLDVPNTTAIQRYNTDRCEAYPMLNALHILKSYLSFSLMNVPTCRQLSQVLSKNPESVLSRNALEGAQLDSYQAIRSLRGSQLEPHFRWSLAETDALRHRPQPGDIGLIDLKRAAVMKKTEFRKICVMNEVKIFWEVDPPVNEAFEMTQISDGIYREMSLEDMEITFTGTLARTEGDTRLFVRKAKRLADENGAIIEDLVFVNETYGGVCFDDISPSFISQLPHPLSFYLHLDEDSVRYYWTFSSTPLSSEEMMAEKPMLDAMGIPRTHLM
ncbi:hypothetical protein FRB99_004387 [Tulasnella sp. 403]|nr:hypothetical protein FRB99_004387 [Tulasnella sp. 403]